MVDKCNLHRCFAMLYTNAAAAILAAAVVVGSELSMSHTEEFFKLKSAIQITVT